MTPTDHLYPYSQQVLQRTVTQDVEELMRGDAGLWQQFAGVASRRSGERLCFLSEHSLDASAWEKIRKLAPPCHSK